MITNKIKIIRELTKKELYDLGNEGIDNTNKDFLYYHNNL